MTGTIFVIFIFLAESGFVQSPAQTSVEPTIISLVSWLELVIELLGAFILAVGVVVAVYEFVLVLFDSSEKNFNRVRLSFARYLLLALEFQLAADIISTAIAPGWEQIGQLAAVAVIRTFLNYFLSLEMKHERRMSETKDRVADGD